MQTQSQKRKTDKRSRTLNHRAERHARRQALNLTRYLRIEVQR